MATVTPGGRGHVRQQFLFYGFEPISRAQALENRTSVKSCVIESDELHGPSDAKGEAKGSVETQPLRRECRRASWVVRVDVYTLL